MAFTAVAAVVAAESVTVAMVFAAVAEIGTALSIVGAVTGDKDLSMLGGVMSLGGMAGGFISGMASAGDAAIGAAASGGEAAAFESGFQGTRALTDSASAVADSATVVGEGAADAFEAGFRGTDALTQAAPAGELATAAGDVSTAAGSAAQPTIGSSVGDGLGVSGPAGVSAPVSPADINPTDMRLAAGTQGSPVSSDNFFSNIWNGIRDPKNKEFVNGALKIGGGLLQGAFAGDTADKDRALRERQVALNEQVGLGELKLKQDQAANSNSQIKFPGIINTARA